MAFYLLCKRYNNWKMHEYCYRIERRNGMTVIATKDLEYTISITFYKKYCTASPSLAAMATLPASCICILSSSIGVVTIIWHAPAKPPASISRSNGNCCLGNRSIEYCDHVILRKILIYVYNRTGTE